MRARANIAEMLEETERRYSGQWYRTRWYRVIAPDGELWCETSDPNEARERMRPGDRLQSLWAREDKQWRDERPTVDQTP